MPPTPTLHFAAFCAVAAICALAAPARADPPLIHVIGDEDACPSPRRVAAELRAVFPERRVVVSEAGAAGSALLVRIWSERLRYGMEVGQTQRVFVDPERRCDDRARSLAVVIALALAPPSLPAPPKKPAAPPPTPSPQRPWRFDLDASFALDLVPSASGQSDVVSPGFALRAALGHDDFSLSLGLGTFASSAQELSRGARARITRTPIELGLRARWRRRAFAVLAEVGVVASLLAIQGEALASALSEVRTEIAMSLGASIEWWATPRFAPFLALRALLVPTPFELAAEPVGVLGTMPRLRLALLFGVIARIH